METSTLTPVFRRHYSMCGMAGKRRVPTLGYPEGVIANLVAKSLHVSPPHQHR